MGTYRIYIDEVGNHDMRHSRDDNERFLTLFGVIIQDGQAKQQIENEMLAIKQEYFDYAPAKPLIFHRADMVNRRGQFHVISTWSQERRMEFGNALLAAFKRWQYRAIVVTIDKKRHLDTYGIWHHEPYYYCLKVLLERYTLFMHYQKPKGKGDVMIESRSRPLDYSLRLAFTGLYTQGTASIGSETWQSCISSRKLKVVPKTDNITGLQLADMLAHPAHYDLLVHYGLVSSQTADFGIRVAKILRDAKYHRKWDGGRIEGYGMKLLP